MLTTAPRGTKDILPRDVEAWRYLERTMREICAQYGYLEIRRLFLSIPSCFCAVSVKRQTLLKKKCTLLLTEVNAV